MYCTNCGRKLPEDGSPCICGAQNGNFNTQPPQYYAQPPVRPVTPVHGMLKRFASSKLFFMCALLFTVQMVVSAVSSVIEVFTVLQNQAYLLERTPIGTNFNGKHCARSKYSGAYRALAAVRLREEDGHAVHEHSGRHAV